LAATFFFGDVSAIFQFFLNWGLVGLLPEVFVGNLLRPSDVEYAPETVVNEYL
jgi:hypothetical protein